METIPHPDEQQSRVLFWVNAVLVSITVTAFAAAILSYVGVDRLRGHVNTWSSVDEIFVQSSDLALLLETARIETAQEANPEVEQAFSGLATTIRQSALDSQLMVSLTQSTLVAQDAYVEHARQRELAGAQLSELTRSLDALASVIKAEVSEVQARQFVSQASSKALEDDLRAHILYSTELADTLTDSEVVLSHLQAMSRLNANSSAGLVSAFIDRLPANCGTATDAHSILCSPSPDRMREAFTRLNLAPPSSDRQALAKQAWRAAQAYNRALHLRFESENAILAERVDDLEKERAVAQGLTNRLRILARLSAISQSIREDVEALTLASASEVDVLKRKMASQLLQLEQRGRGYLRDNEPFVLSATHLVTGAATLRSAWLSAVSAEEASIVSAKAMSNALSDMQSEILVQTNERRRTALGWISAFTSSTLVAIILFVVFISAIGMIAIRKVARPLRHVVGIILSMARGVPREPIAVPSHAGAMQDVYRALEILRRAQEGRKEAEQRASKTTHELKATHERMTSLADSAPSGLYEMVMTPDGELRFEYASRKFETLYCCSAIDQPFNDALSFVEDTDRASFMEAVRGSAGRMEPLRHRHRVTHPVRGTLWISNESIPSMGRGGAIHWVGAASDITDEVTQEQMLREARDKAEAANSAKSLFLANMSHEIRTPMNGIIGMCDLVGDTDMTAEQKFCLDTIGQSAENLLCVINDVLDLSKLEASKLEVLHDPLDLEELAHDVCKIVSELAWTNQTELVVDYDARLGSRMGDAGKIRQILLNLLGNATKFTEGGCVTLRVKELDDALVRISVEDTGMGIAVEDLKRIFNPFEQVDNEHTRQFDGTGLGLSICKGMVELMGGEIEVSSALGRGSTFGFTLSLPPAPAESSTIPVNQLVGQTVLLIETSSASRKSLKRQLQSMGAEVIATKDVEDALGKLQASPDRAPAIDTVVLDYKLLDQDLDGLRLEDSATGESRARLIAHAPLEFALSASEHRKAVADKWLVRPAKISEVAQAVALAANTETSTSGGAVIPFGSAGDDGVSVLLVEDNRTNQVIAQKMLHKLGVEPRLVGNGEEALSTYVSEPADLIFMDVSMPVMNGLEATKYIRAFERQNNMTPSLIVALTAHASDKDRTACLSAGMDRFISKPVKIEHLARALQQARVNGYQKFG